MGFRPEAHDEERDEQNTHIDTSAIHCGATRAMDVTYRITSDVRCSFQIFQLVSASPSSTGTANRVPHQPTVEPVPITNAAHTTHTAQEFP
jgi:hypothetical protein